MTNTPFVLAVPDADLEDLHRRIVAARWPAADAGPGWDRGVPLDTARQLAHHWRHNFEWRRAEQMLNRYPQFIHDAAGQPIHFFHVRSAAPDAMPLLMLHGWPSTSIEFIGLVDRLTNPAAHGGNAADAFHVVLPTTPGFGLSSPVDGRWDAPRTAAAYHGLMRSLGYTHWGVHGGDVGADIAGEMNHISGGLVGVHVSTDLPSLIWYARFTGGDPANDPSLTAEDRQVFAEVAALGANDGGYLEIQRTRPQTLSYLLNDSPVGQLVWIAEKFRNWTADGNSALEDTIDLDQMLTIVSLYWFTMSGSSAAHFLCTNLRSQRDWSRPSYAPVGMAVFGARGNPRALQDPEHQLSHWSEFVAGGHFPAMEVPDLLVTDLRTFFRALRNR